jgi:hypothetical protein
MLPSCYLLCRGPADTAAKLGLFAGPLHGSSLAAASSEPSSTPTESFTLIPLLENPPAFPSGVRDGLSLLVRLWLGDCSGVGVWVTSGQLFCLLRIGEDSNLFDVAGRCRRWEGERVWPGHCWILSGCKGNDPEVFSTLLAEGLDWWVSHTYCHGRPQGIGLALSSIGSD